MNVWEFRQWVEGQMTLQGCFVFSVVLLFVSWLIVVFTE